MTRLRWKRVTAASTNQSRYSEKLTTQKINADMKSECSMFSFPKINKRNVTLRMSEGRFNFSYVSCSSSVLIKLWKKKNRNLVLMRRNHPPTWTPALSRHTDCYLGIKTTRGLCSLLLETLQERKWNMRQMQLALNGAKTTREPHWVQSGQHLTPRLLAVIRF